jgi:luciferase family oxidoreductase group 1
MPSVTSSAPEILIGHVAAMTSKIRVGSGGMMLPNHPPLRVAEVFQTLAALFPDRIDLGLGRAPGSDQIASRALRAIDGERFPALLAELIAFSTGAFPAGHPFASVVAMPSGVPLPPIWMLGSSGASADMAGQLGTGYGFAGHFSAASPIPAMRAYRAAFRPSPQFRQPHAVLCVAAICANTEEEADYLAASIDLAWLRIRRGQFLPLPSSDEARAYPYSEIERAAIADYRRQVLVGTPERVCERIELLAVETGADEIMIAANLHDHAGRMRSYELIAAAMGCAVEREMAEA